MKKLNKDFVHYLKNDLEMSDKDISISSANEIFAEVLTYEGHGKFADTAIKSWIKQIYGIDLDDISINIWMKEEM